MAQVLLVRPSTRRYYRTSPVGGAITRSPPLNLARLAAALRVRGHEVSVLDLEVRPLRHLARALRRLRPDVVGVSFRTPQWNEAEAIARTVARLHPRALRVAGGPHPSARPRAVVRGGAFHVAVRGEGESTLVRLVERGSSESIPGVTRPGLHSEDAPPLRDLDALPFPAWDLFDLSHYRRASFVARLPPVADLETSRGCPAACVYCSKRVFGHGFRPMSAERALDEVDAALAAGFRSFNLVDDAFTTDLHRATAFCEGLIRRGSPLPWTCTNGLRVAETDRTFFRTARAAGCWLAAFGLETGSDRLLQKIGKRATVDQARRAVRAAHREGIVTVGYFMLGLPGETEQSLRQTLRFALDLDLDLAKFSLAMPLPGTPLYTRWAAFVHHPDGARTLDVHRPAPTWFDHPDLRWETLEAARRRAWVRFYGRPRSLVPRLSRLIFAGTSPRGQKRSPTAPCSSPWS